jgi:molybdopterin molybdotransferase
VRQALTEAGETYDALITSGGASRGEEDHVVTTLNELGTLAMWQLAIKPGRPMSFGRIGGSVFVGLPGNPVAVMVCFLLYVRPMLLRLSGAAWPQPRRYRLPAGFAMNKKPDRREFLRGIIAEEGPNGLTVDKFERDGSGLITSLRQADGLIEIGEETTAIKPGDPVDFLPFSELGIAPS